VFDENNTTAAWRYVNVSTLTDSPFNTPLREEDRNPAADRDGKSGLALRECTSYQFDAFKLYPRAYLLPDGHRILFTRDGDFNSLRERTGCFMRNTKFTYILNVSGTSDDPSV
jgi:hypothetical protein